MKIQKSAFLVALLALNIPLIVKASDAHPKSGDQVILLQEYNGLKAGTTLLVDRYNTVFKTVSAKPLCESTTVKFYYPNARYLEQDVRVTTDPVEIENGKSPKNCADYTLKFSKVEDLELHETLIAGIWYNFAAEMNAAKSTSDISGDSAAGKNLGSYEKIEDARKACSDYMDLLRRAKDPHGVRYECYVIGSGPYAFKIKHYEQDPNGKWHIVEGEN